MKLEDLEKFGQIMTGLAEMYGREISDGAQSLWFEALKKYDIDTISAAASAHVSSPDNGQYFPKPADIIRMIGGTSKESAFLAWTKVDKAVRMVGPHQTVVFDDPLIHAVIEEMGGWIVLGEKSEDEWPFVGNEFKARYLGYKGRGERPEYNGKLIGISEAENAKNGFHPPPPVLIGDSGAAHGVISNATGRRMQITTLRDGLIEALGKVNDKPRLRVVGQ